MLNRATVNRATVIATIVIAAIITSAMVGVPNEASWLMFLVLATIGIVFTVMPGRTSR